jgi:hypothetical protein
LAPTISAIIKGQQLLVRRVSCHRLRGNARSLFGDRELLPMIFSIQRGFRRSGNGDPDPDSLES